MRFIPLPFVVAILLLVPFIVAIRHDDEHRPPNIPFLGLILANVLQSLLVGLRWGYGVQAVMYVAPIVAATMPRLCIPVCAI